MPTPRVAAAAGTVLLLAALAGYYATVQVRFGYGTNGPILLFWGFGSVAGGLVFGSAGWWWRHGTARPGRRHRAARGAVRRRGRLLPADPARLHGRRGCHHRGPDPAGGRPGPARARLGIRGHPARARARRGGVRRHARGLRRADRGVTAVPSAPRPRRTQQRPRPVAPRAAAPPAALDARPPAAPNARPPAAPNARPHHQRYPTPGRITSGADASRSLFFRPGRRSCVLHERRYGRS